MMTSENLGETWGDPVCLVNSSLDDRDAGICRTSSGAMLVTWFNSFAWLANLLHMRPEVNRDSWWRRTGEVNDELIDKEIGTWIIRSEDHGATWSSRIDSLVSSPHGPAQLSDGRLIYVGRCRVDKGRRGRNGSALEPGVPLAVAESDDDGLNWRIISRIPVREDDDGGEYHEPHASQAPDGKMVVVIRNHNIANHHELLQCESSDGGMTWSIPHATDTKGFPGHLLGVDGTLIMVYGIRIEPFGIGVRISRDSGSTWGQPVRLCNDSPSPDLGYPSTASIGNGRFLTIWYEARQHTAVLRQAKWSIV